MTIQIPTEVGQKVKGFELSADSKSVLKKEYEVVATEQTVSREVLQGMVDKYAALLAIAQAELDSYSVLEPSIVDKK